MMPGVLLFVLSCVVYGVAFDFFNVSGGLFVNAECDESVKASAQGLFMLMTNGLGATIGTLLAGQIINHYCQWTEDGYLLGAWQTPRRKPSMPHSCHALESSPKDIMAIRGITCLRT